MMTHDMPVAILPHKEITRPGGGVRNKGRFFKGAWVHKDGERRVVLSRVSDLRYPIYGVKVPIRDSAEDEYAKLEGKIDELFYKKLDHELKYRAGVL